MSRVFAVACGLIAYVALTVDAVFVIPAVIAAFATLDTIVADRTRPCAKCGHKA